MFADDVVLLAENTEDLKELIRETELWASRWGMEINPQKCGAFQTMPSGEPTELKTQTGKIPWVEEYRYLGVIFGNKDNRKSRNKAERIRGHALVTEHMRTLQSLFVPLYHKALVIRGIITPSIMYGKEVGGCAAAAEIYAEHFTEKSSVLTLPAIYPELNSGWRQVLRIICGYYWTCPVLVKAKIIQEEMKEFCPGCQSKIEETATHIVWDC
ncbi:MAG: uncharacterized protein A8A55_3211, partial [Amphiamblys sp. WSBS2006]